MALGRELARRTVEEEGRNRRWKGAVKEAEEGEEEVGQKRREEGRPRGQASGLP